MMDSSTSILLSGLGFIIGREMALDIGENHSTTVGGFSSLGKKCVFFAPERAVVVGSL